MSGGNNPPGAIALPVSTLAIAAANGSTLVLPIATTQVATTQVIDSHGPIGFEKESLCNVFLFYLSFLISDRRWRN